MKLAGGQFHVDVTDRAKADYVNLKRAADIIQVMRPLRDRTLDEVNLVAHFDRTRSILIGLKDSVMTLDVSMVGIWDFVKYRANCGTTVYFVRKPWSVMVLAISDSPLDFDGIYEAVITGNEMLLVAAGIIPLQEAIRRPTQPVALQ